MGWERGGGLLEDQPTQLVCILQGCICRICDLFLLIIQLLYWIYCCSAQYIQRDDLNLKDSFDSLIRLNCIGQWQSQTCSKTTSRLSTTTKSKLLETFRDINLLTGCSFQEALSVSISWEAIWTCGIEEQMLGVSWGAG